MKKRGIILLAIALVWGMCIHAQTVSPAYIQAVKFAKEVYKGHPEYQTEGSINDYMEILSRVTVRNYNPVSDAGLPFLSSVPLRNKYNPELSSDVQGFNPGEFNILKYQLSFFPPQTLSFRVDNTNYVVAIAPKQ